MFRSFFSFFILFNTVMSKSVYFETNGLTNWADTEKLSHHNLSFPGYLYFSLKTCQPATLTLHPLVVGERSLTLHFEESDQAGNVYGTASFGRVTDSMAISDDDYSHMINISSSCDRFQTYWMYASKGYVYFGSGCTFAQLYRNGGLDVVTVTDMGISSVGLAEWLFVISKSVYFETNGLTNWADTEKLSHHNLSFPGYLYFSLKTCQPATLTLHPLVVGERSLTFHFEKSDQAGNVYGTALFGRVTDSMAISDDDYSHMINISSSCDRFQTYWMYASKGYVYFGSGCRFAQLYRNSGLDVVTVTDVGISSVGLAEWLFASSCNTLNASLPNKTDATTQGITTDNGDTGTTVVSPVGGNISHSVTTGVDSDRTTTTPNTEKNGSALEITCAIWLLTLAQMLFVVRP